MRQYVGMFGDWADVVNAYQFELFEEPEHIFASYDGDYECFSLVAYYTNGKFYTVEGSHCSCCGLEDQWEPEEYSVETFKAMIDRLPDRESDWSIDGFKKNLIDLYLAVTL